MKSIKKSIFPLALIAFILLASPGAAGQGEKTTGTKSILAPTGAETLNKKAIMAKVASLAVPFVPNAGRFDKEVLFSADLFSGRFFLTDRELVYSLRERLEKENTRPDKGLAIKEYFIDEKGARIFFHSAGEKKAPTKISYFRGNDPAKWQCGLAAFNGVSLGNVYPGIQVKLTASAQNVEKIFYVSPGSDVARIKIGVAGVKGLIITNDGRLQFKNSLGELAMRAPVAWQEIDGRRHDVQVRYRLLGKRFYGFSVSGKFNKNHPLIIDPALDTVLASTYLGGKKADVGYALALDSSGNVYISGTTWSANFPATAGAYDPTYNGGDDYNDIDVFVAKLDKNLHTLLASTFLGGGGYDANYSLSLDRAGNVYLGGNTTSPEFPVTPTAYDRTINPQVHVEPPDPECPDYYPSDIFVSKLDSGLTLLLASTFLGGKDPDAGRSLALDFAGNVYITGVANSIDFPTTPGAYDRDGGGYYASAIISKLDGDLTELLASTYLGGSGYTEGRSLALDKTGNVYLTGYTEVSTDFPTTPGAYDRTHNNVTDAFVSKLDGNLSTLLASTYLGGSGFEDVHSLVLDGSSNVFVAGWAYSEDYPTTPGAYDRVCNGFDGFISKLNGNLTTLLASTFLGGSWMDDSYSLALDNSGNVCLTGHTWSDDFPTTPGAYDRTHNGSMNSYMSDAFVSILDHDLTTLLDSTYLGGSSIDIARSLAIDKSGNIYLTGELESANFPTTPRAFDRTLNNNSNSWGDVFVTKLNGRLDPSISVTSPKGGESWVAGIFHGITWVSSAKIADARIEVSIDNGKSWSDVAVSPARYRTYPWTVPNTPSRQCLVRISDNDHPDISDVSDGVFTILMNIDLVAERREVRAFSIQRQYALIRFLADVPLVQTSESRFPRRVNSDGHVSARAETSFESKGDGALAFASVVQVAQYRLMRRQGNGDFALLKTIAPSELRNNQFQMQDKYLEKGTQYTYRVEAYDAAGQLVGISPEKAI